MKRILVIQTAFIGDVVLATSMLESLHGNYPVALIDILVRKGNELLFIEHPFINKVLIWDKKNSKYLHLFKLLFAIRKKKYTAVLNIQRYAASGLLTAFSGAAVKIGFNKNPFRFFFTKVVSHNMQQAPGLHEIERNHQLAYCLETMPLLAPQLYPSVKDAAIVKQYKQRPYICIAPSSVWFTKQFPEHKWIAFIQSLPNHITVYLLGAPADAALCNRIIERAATNRCMNLAGKISFLQSASLMKDALMNYVNDSAPMHFCSAVNAPVTAIYCSTIPAFGYGPLCTIRHIVEVQENLNCRPCGTHGKRGCPLTHFNCAEQILNSQLLATLPAQL